MDLSEAPGLVLFRVVREGIGISQRLSATGTCAPTGDWDAHPRTRASQEPTDHHQKKITGDFTEAKCHRHLCAYRRLGCSPSNPSVSRTNGPPPEKDHRRWKGSHRRRSSGLRF